MARSLHRSLEEVSWQDLLDKICIRDLLARYLYEICTRSLYQSSVGKISVRDLMARSLYKSLEEVSWQDLLDHTLCEPAQSKCTSTLHNRHQKSHFTLKLEYMSTFHKRHQKSHFIQKFTGKMPRPRLGPERGHTLCASLRSRNACPHFGPRMRHTLCASLRSRNACPHFTRDIRRATLLRNLQEKCHGPDAAKNRSADVVRACAIETHVKISQEPLCTEIYRKNAAAQNLGAHCVRACAVETRVKISQEPLYAAICRSNAADQREHVSTLIKHRPSHFS